MMSVPWEERGCQASVKAVLPERKLKAEALFFCYYNLSRSIQTIAKSEFQTARDLYHATAPPDTKP